MKNTIEIKSWFNSSILFSYTCEDNTIGKTLKEAIKQGVSLAYANLSYSNLHGADLSDANLSFADLSFADLSDANLSNTKLIGASLIKTNLYNAILFNTNLEGSNLYTANLLKANVINTKGLNDQCPKEGSFIGWKKCINKTRDESYIVKLEIPADAKRSSATTNKCRCDKAKTLEIQNLNGSIADIKQVYSASYPHFKYEVGEIVKSDSFDDRYWVECSHGIHFFMNRDDAVNY